MEEYLPRFFEFSALCAVIYLLGFCYRAASRFKTVFKTLSIASLAVAALLAGTPLWLPLALSACALGDYYLSQDGAPEFLKGVGAFSLGHVFYIILFLSDPLSDMARLGAPPRTAALYLLAVVSLLMLGLLWYSAGKLRRAVAGYLVIITVMAVASITLPWQAYYNNVLLGALFFVLSDLILSLELFVLPKTGWIRAAAPFAVWTLYWLAQVLITAGLVLREVMT